MSEPTQYLIHLAAGPVRVGSVIRTRCGWCGALVDEVDLANIAVAGASSPEEATAIFTDPDGKPRARWQGLVAIEEHEGSVRAAYKWAVPEPVDGKAPAKSCMKLPDDATG